jgi:hypothetical protein
VTTVYMWLAIGSALIGLTMVAFRKFMWASVFAFYLVVFAFFTFFMAHLESLYE